MKVFKKTLCLFLSVSLLMPIQFGFATRYAQPDPDDPRRCTEFEDDDDRKEEYYYKKGCYKGRCNDDDDDDNEKTDICFVPKRNPSDCFTLKVTNKKLPAYLKTGSYIGNCDHKVVICKRSKNLEVDRSSLKSHLKNGATIGYCDDTPDDQCSNGRNHTVCQYPGTHYQKTIHVKSCRMKKYYHSGCRPKRCDDTPTPAPSTGAPTRAPTMAPGTSSPTQIPPPPSLTPAPTWCYRPSCGNGIIDEGEACDDGNVSNDGRCLSNCHWAFCGDGHVWTNVEDCDPGSAEETRDCNRDCTLSQCGDGILNLAAGEQCDNGALNGALGGCSATCQKQYNCGNGIKDTGEQCDMGFDNSNTSFCLQGTCKKASCGDGYLFNGFEKCDDGNFVDTDFCADCRDAFCGDGITSPSEECDDGRGVNTGLCLTTCRLNRCGDGFAHFGIEECDHGLLNADNSTCTSACVLGFCGDGLTMVGREQCDNGHLSNDSDCTAGCRKAFCGDGFVQTGVEVCDQGTQNGNGGGYCKSDCSGIEKIDWWTTKRRIGVGVGAALAGALASIVMSLSYQKFFAAAAANRQK